MSLLTEVEITAVFYINLMNNLSITITCQLTLRTFQQSKVTQVRLLLSMARGDMHKISDAASTNLLGCEQQSIQNFPGCRQKAYVMVPSEHFCSFGPLQQVQLLSTQGKLWANYRQFSYQGHHKSTTKLFFMISFPPQRRLFFCDFEMDYNISNPWVLKRAQNCHFSQQSVFSTTSFSSSPSRCPCTVPVVPQSPIHFQIFSNLF